MAAKTNFDLRRDLIYFLLGPGLAAMAVAGLFQIHPWPTALASQAQGLGWPPTIAYLLVGALGAMLSSKVGCPSAPSARNAARWREIFMWSMVAGCALGVIDLSIYAWTPWGAHLTAVDKGNGYTWANVALPWSLAHYLQGAIVLECAFRLAAIIIPAWLIGRLILRGRFSRFVFWAFAVLAAFIEPLEKAILLRKIPLADLQPMDLAMNVEAIVAQVIFAVLLRRFGWPAPILARYGYYLVVRIFGGYLFPHVSEMYPGPH